MKKEIITLIVVLLAVICGITILYVKDYVDYDDNWEKAVDDIEISQETTSVSKKANSNNGKYYIYISDNSKVEVDKLTYDTCNVNDEVEVYRYSLTTPKTLFLKSENVSAVYCSSDMTDEFSKEQFELAEEKHNKSLMYEIWIPAIFIVPLVYFTIGAIRYWDMLW